MCKRRGRNGTGPIGPQPHPSSGLFSRCDSFFACMPAVPKRASAGGDGDPKAKRPKATRVSAAKETPSGNAGTAGPAPAAAASAAHHFTGFGSELVGFYRMLNENNDRDWWHAGGKEVYEAHVAGPMKHLSAALQPTYGPLKIFRPYRDMRFNPDQKPLQEHASMVTQGTGGSYYLQVSAEGLLVAGGLWRPSAKALGKFRALVDDPKRAAQVHKALDSVASEGYVLCDDGRLSTAPQGFRKDHPEIELLRYKSLAVMKRLPVGPWLTKPACLDKVLHEWGIIRKWNAWLQDNIC